MKLLVTGASGFLGKHVVAELLRRGHGVRAMVRPGTDESRLPWCGSDVEFAKVDMRSRTGLVDAVRGVDVVIHTAATKSGDLYEQLGGTVVATENLLDAMKEAGVEHIVGISSFSVYEYLGRYGGGLINEGSKLAVEPGKRDEYCQTKLLQEKLIREYATEHRWRWTILRPGVIYGRGNTWTARLGVKLSESRWLLTGLRARLPLSYVENCADAIALSMENVSAYNQVINVIDDECPSQLSYARKIAYYERERPRLIPIPWTAMRVIARFGRLTNIILFGGRAKIPGIFDPAKLHARCKPMRYSNSCLHNVLDWRQRYTLDEALERSYGDMDTASLDGR